MAKDQPRRVQMPMPTAADLQIPEHLVVPTAPAEPEHSRGRFAPTEEQRNAVLFATGIGFTYTQICKLVLNPNTGKPIEERTLIEHFSHELDVGKARVEAVVAGNLFALSKTHTKAAIFLLSTRFPHLWAKSEALPAPDETPEGERSRLELARRLAFLLREASEKRAGGAVDTPEGSG